MRRPKLIAPGVYKYPNGKLRAMVRIHRGRGGRPSKMFDAGTSLLVIRQWRQQQKTAPRQETPTRTGFEADARRYLSLVQAMPSYTDRERDIETWIGVFGERPRADITPADIRAALTRWQQDGKAASTLNHRRTALMHLWRLLDGSSAANPVKEVPKLREPAPEPRGVDYATIQRILDAMPESKSKARLAVIAHTGLPHASLARLKPEHLDLERRIVFMPARQKGHGAHGRTLPLTEAAVTAFRAFMRWECFGPFSRSTLHRGFRKAVKKAAPELARRLRPYDLRHSYGTAVFAATGDIRSTQVLLGHSKAEMTHRYTLGAVDARVREAVDRVQMVTSRSHTAKKSEGM